MMYLRKYSISTSILNYDALESVWLTSAKVQTQVSIHTRDDLIDL